MKKKENKDIKQKGVAGGERRSENFTFLNQKFHFFDQKIYIIFTFCQTLGGAGRQKLWGWFGGVWGGVI